MRRPAILLLDEPTVGCDNESYERILALLQKMKQQGTAMLLISHGRGELEEMADRIVYLKEGKMVGES
jgi:ABC superfamily ATP binding cassette transporter, ABC protein